MNTLLFSCVVAVLLVYQVVGFEWCPEALECMKEDDLDKDELKGYMCPGKKIPDTEPINKFYKCVFLEKEFMDEHNKADRENIIKLVKKFYGEEHEEKVEKAVDVCGKRTNFEVINPREAVQCFFDYAHEEKLELC